MKNFESRIKKLEEKLNPKSNAINVNLDLTKLNNEDIDYLSNMFKRFSSEEGKSFKFDYSKLEKHDLDRLDDISKKCAVDTEEN